MSININVPDEKSVTVKISVFGVGGAGGNAVNNMVNMKVSGVDFLVANTDAQALNNSAADVKIQLGETLTKGLGAGSKPEVGAGAAEESVEHIKEYLKDCNLVFIAAGMGGGTGTGAAPVIAKVARDLGVLTIGVVTKPFHFEGSHRMKMAEEGVNEMQKHVDTLIVIPNQNLFHKATEKTTFADAFKMVDDVLYSGIKGITDLMTMPGLINLDFADIRAIMGGMGRAMMGTGEANGEKRALDAAEAAISNPLLDNVSMRGASGVLINISGGLDMTLFEADEAAQRIKDEVDNDANIIFGSTFDENLDGKIRVSVVATGIDGVKPIARADEYDAPRRKTQEEVQHQEEVFINQQITENEAATNPDLTNIDDLVDGEESRDADDSYFIPPQPEIPDLHKNQVVNEQDVADAVNHNDEEIQYDAGLQMQDDNITQTINQAANDVNSSENFSEVMQQQNNQQSPNLVTDAPVPQQENPAGEVNKAAELNSDKIVQAANSKANDDSYAAVTTKKLGKLFGLFNKDSNNNQASNKSPVTNQVNNPVTNQVTNSATKNVANVNSEEEKLKLSDDFFNLPPSMRNKEEA
jgi:cell division protein FtsZ